MGRLSTTEGLLQWFRFHNGFVHESVEFAEEPSNGIFLRVKPSSVGINSETIVLKCPFTVSISVLNALDTSPFQAHSVQHLPDAFLQEGDDRSILAYFVMQQYLLGDESFWAPYIKSLPQPFDEGAFSTPLWWDEDDLRWLNGTSMASTAKAMKENLTNQWQALHASGLFSHDYSWELFKWATEVIDSRSFTSVVLRDAVAGNSASESAVATGKAFDVLLPMIDALNHHGTAAVRWLFNANSFDWMTITRLAPGAEIFNNYGPRSNDELLLRYGFSSPNNPFDRLFIRVESTRAGTPHWKDKQFYIRSLDFFERGYKDPSYQHSNPWLRQLPDKLLALLACGAANFRERQTIELQNASGLIEYGARTSITITAELKGILCAHEARLQLATAEMLSTPKNFKQWNAKTYRDGQLLILATAIASLDDGLFEAIVQDLDIESSTISRSRLRSQRAGPKLLRLKTGIKFLQASNSDAHKALTTALKQCCGTANLKKLRDAGWEDVVWASVLAGILSTPFGDDAASESTPKAETADLSSGKGDGAENNPWRRVSRDFHSFLQSHYGTQAQLQNEAAFQVHMQALETQNLAPLGDFKLIKDAAAKVDPSSIWADGNDIRNTSSPIWQAWAAYVEESVRLPIALIGGKGKEGEETLMYFWHDNETLEEAERRLQ